MRFQFIGADGLAGHIGQAVGAASTCWESLDGTGVFQEQRAREIVNALQEYIEQNYLPKQTTTVQDDMAAIELARAFGIRVVGFDLLNPARIEFVTVETDLQDNKYLRVRSIQPATRYMSLLYAALHAAVLAGFDVARWQEENGVKGDPAI